MKAILLKLNFIPLLLELAVTLYLIFAVGAFDVFGAIWLLYILVGIGINYALLQLQDLLEPIDFIVAYFFFCLLFILPLFFGLFISILFVSGGAWD